MTKVYTRFQILASVSIAVFILNFSLVLLAENRSAYTKALQKTQAEGQTVEDASGSFESKMIYEQLAASFAKWGTKSYDVSGYQISETNTRKLNELKRYYKRAWVLGILSLGVSIYALIRLSRRRMFMPLVYGALLALFGVCCFALRVMTSGKEIFSALRAMIMRGDYGYFADDDILISVLPETFARRLACWYLILVIALGLVSVLIRQLIYYVGRPHRF